jgi:hypothetical protein
MNRLNADGHDESQYLPKVLDKITGKIVSLPPVNAFRERQGGVRYEGTSIKAMQWLPDILFDRENERERPYNDTCVSFYGYYVQTGQALGVSDVRNILFDRLEEGTQLPPVDTFAAIMRGLVKPESHMLLWVVCDDRNRGNLRLANHLIGTIRHAVEHAQEIIDALTAKRRKAKDDSEAIDSVPRNAII